MADRRPTARIMAGIPKTSAAIYHRIRFCVGDPVALVELPDERGGLTATLILRDIERDRARNMARADQIACPADFAPEGGLSGDRETATAQAAAELLHRAGIKQVVADRSLPLIFAEFLRRAGIDLVCDLDRGVADRRAKDAQEIDWIREAQAATESVMQRACETVARATPRADGVLLAQGEPLTSERLRAAIDHWLIDLGYDNPSSIVAGGPLGADCHDYGHGELRTAQPVIIDIFPRNKTTLYNGDCTRTVVHGDIPDLVRAMHEAVIYAKAAATAVVRAGVSGEDVHRATVQSLRAAGFDHGLPPDDAPDSYCALTHGTGHGVGLDVHEPPLLDFKGPELIAGDVVTIEPGLYRRDTGGVRVEDVVVVNAEGCENLGRLPEGLQW